MIDCCTVHFAIGVVTADVHRHYVLFPTCVWYLFSQTPFPCLGKVVQVIRSVVCFLHHALIHRDGGQCFSS